MNPTIWRFLPGIDPRVDTLLVRDLDSIITSREAHAVNRFLHSNEVTLWKYLATKIAFLFKITNNYSRL